MYAYLLVNQRTNFIFSIQEIQQGGTGASHY